MTKNAVYYVVGFMQCGTFVYVAANGGWTVDKFKARTFATRRAAATKVLHMNRHDLIIEEF